VAAGREKQGARLRVRGGWEMLGLMGRFSVFSISFFLNSKSYILNNPKFYND
jgi:hypothetical protein